jgi:hypothetical protein
MKYLFTFTTLFIFNSTYAQVLKKSIEANRTSTAPKIDGILESEVWNKASKAINWTQVEPKNGNSERDNQKSEAYFSYDDRALYIGARLYDYAPDSILKEFSLRDQTNKNCDLFGVKISPYNDGQNNFVFFVSAAGVQTDALSSVQNTELNWDAVWKSEINIDDKGWTVEIEIPYSALRIPKTEVQEWGINMFREIRRTREVYSWSPIDLSNSNESAQAGVLTGIENIQTPLRLSFMPYLSSYVDFYESESSSSLNGGLDVKYGINESFTLDMTLVPDFGQTVFDDQILNVSPFEIQFNENRSFFTEGTELFTKANLFYSRRIGDSPSLSLTLADGEVLSQNPTNVQLLNASKISGRTSKGLGIGFFNAITENTYATIHDSISGQKRKELIEPLSNYNVVVLDQVLKNNSYITFTNTNVSRKGNARDANVEKLQIQIGTKDNSYTFYGDLAFSHVKEDLTTNNGFASFLLFEKSSGNFRFSAAQNIESDKYDINDIGFLYNNNEMQHSGNLAYYIFTPKGKLRRADFEIGLSRSLLYEPSLYNSTDLSADIGIHLTNFFSTGISFDQSIGKTYNYFEARTNDLQNVFESGPSTNLYWWNSTDYRNKFAGDLGFGYNTLPEFGSKSYQIRWSPRFRVNDHVFMTYVISHKVENNNVGRALDANGPIEDPGNILFSKRDRRTTTNVYRLSYVLSAKLSFDFKLRHYWSTLKHKTFYALNDGVLTGTNFPLKDERNKALYDINYNSWNIDLNCVWRFAPGSELNLQWKNSLYSLTDDASLSTQQNLSELFKESQGNSLSLKLIYFLDYQNIKRLKK